MTTRVSMSLVIVIALFVVTLVAANVMAVKLFYVFGHVLPVAIIVFPLSYIIGDVLTEVYGYRMARRVIWIGFGCNALVVLFFWLGGLLPSAQGVEVEEAYNRILGAAPRILGASFAAYLIGEFANSFVLARMKVAMQGRLLWARTIFSTVVGQGLDSTVFITLVFAGTVPAGVLGSIILTQWLAKVMYETAATPLTYVVVRFLKSKESLDVYDTDTRFNPFAVME
jgi:uncharacterized integral membrane protein (TIGR00697 family)